MFVFVQAGRSDVIIDILTRKSPWPELGSGLCFDVWERNAQGCTIRDIAAARGGVQGIAEAIHQMQQHWLEHDRPPALQHQHTSLISDLINIVQQYVDGFDQQGQPLEEPTKPTAAEE